MRSPIFWRDEREVAEGGEIVLEQHALCEFFLVFDRISGSLKLFVIVLCHESLYSSDERTVPVGAYANAASLTATVDDIFRDILPCVPQSLPLQNECLLD